MSDRDVTVTLRAITQQFDQAMKNSAKNVKELGTEGEKVAQMRQAFDGIGRSALAMGAVIGAGVTVAIAKFADFDAAMSNVQAATGESTENMALLRQAAIDAGASTVFSATEAAGAIEELAKAGVSTSNILSGALAGSLDLAAAGQLGVARAAEITSTAMNQFGLSGDQAAHVADVLSAGAGKAMGSVEDLANGLKFVGPVAASMGVSLEETTGVLALFAQQGIIGEQAGTSLRGVLSSLTSPSAQARKEIERLGISLYDSQGNFLGLENAAGQLSRAYAQMDGASRDASLGIIFGRETVTAATALYQAGAKGVDQWTEAVDDSGFAAEQARQRLDNLKGDLEALQGALDSALIETGSGANAVLRDMVQALTGLVGAYGDLPTEVQQTVLAIGGATAAVALASGTAFTAIPRFLELKSTVNAAGISMKGLALGAGGVGLALGGLFAILGQVAQSHAEAEARAESYASTLEDGTHRITEATKELIAVNLQQQPGGFWESLTGPIDGPGSVLDAADRLGVELGKVVEAAAGSSDAIRELSPYLQRLRDDEEFAADEAERLGLSTYDLELAALKVQNGIKGESESLDEAARKAEQKEEATRALAAADDEAAGKSKSAAAAYLEAADSAGQLTSELEQLISEINEANGVGQDAIAANVNYQNALAKVDETIQKAREGQEGYALGLDLSTQAGRNNLDMLNGLAAQSQAAADAQYALDGNTQAYKANLEAGRQTLIDRAMQLGMNADEAGRLADQIYRIPTEHEFTVIANTNDAMSKVAQLKASLEAFRNSDYGVNVSGYIKSLERAAGGPVFGPGTGTSDSVPAMLSNGEHVWTAAEVQAAGGHGAMAQMRQAVLEARQSPLALTALTAHGGELVVVENVHPPIAPQPAGATR